MEGLLLGDAFARFRGIRRDVRGAPAPNGALDRSFDAAIYSYGTCTH